MEKLTKRDYFNRILAYAHEEDKDFLRHEMELLEKKNASRSYTIAEIKALVPELAEANPQKVSAIVTKMRKEIRVSREMVKGKAYFTKI